MTEQLVRTSSEDGIHTLMLARPDKRNAISDRLLAALEAALVAIPEGTRAVVLAGEGKHFCAGLDLSEHQHRDAFGTMLHSQSWHRIFARIQNGGIPVIAAMQGAVIGGGLELASAAHIRVAEPNKNSAVAFASSVLPTPVGPTNSSTPAGRSGFESPVL